MENADPRRTRVSRVGRFWAHYCLPTFRTRLGLRIPELRDGDEPLEDRHASLHVAPSVGEGHLRHRDRHEAREEQQPRGEHHA